LILTPCTCTAKDWQKTGDIKAINYFLCGMNMDHLLIDTALVTQVLKEFLKEEVYKANFKKVIFGLSGGVDSSVVAYLCASVFPGQDITALIMPFRSSNPKNIEDAKMVAQSLKIKYTLYDISPMVDAFFQNDKNVDFIRKGNKMARERMCVLYDFSTKNNALVIGTSNKTELLLGYGTIFGDLASAINPIGDLYKTQILQLADHLGVPEKIIKKPPSADLWAGQTDESELGYTYQQIDSLLYYLIDLRYPEKMLLDLNFSKKMVKDIQNRIKKFQFKRRPPIIAKLSNRTINQDFRYCRDWGV
jgi:NAD+ synthase